LLIRRKNNNEFSAEKDRYLITYADLITLLLGLFVILYASSKVDEEKFKEFSKAFNMYFDNPGVLEGGDGVMEARKDNIPEPVLPHPNQKTLDQIMIEAESALSGLLQDGKLSIKRTSGGIMLTLPEVLLFQSAKAEVQPDGEKVLDTLASILKGIGTDMLVTVDGHTDSNPIRTFQYESNWHLSVARATNVAYRMMQMGLPEYNVAIRGFGAQRPKVDNSNPENRAINRRVEITISELPDDAPSVSGYSQ
jgi:chemotaxis protein MotB